MERYPVSYCLNDNEQIVFIQYALNHYCEFSEGLPARELFPTLGIIFEYGRALLYKDAMDQPIAIAGFIKGTLPQPGVDETLVYVLMIHIINSYRHTLLLRTLAEDIYTSIMEVAPFVNEIRFLIPDANLELKRMTSKVADYAGVGSCTLRKELRYSLSISRFSEQIARWKRE